MKKYHRVVEHSRQRLARLGKIESRTQFGGYALTVERVVFALINEDQLYLRASEALREYAVTRQLEPLVFRKRGMPVSLNYYKVDEALWQNPDHLLALSVASLKTARGELDARLVARRLKDLPNLTLRLEMLLHEAGVDSVQLLCEIGARECWLKLKAINQHVGFKTLLALQGAITGRHQAALTQEVKAELDEWYQNVVKTPSSPHGDER